MKKIVKQIELPEKLNLSTNIDRLLGEIENMNEDSEPILCFKDIQYIQPETIVLLISLSQQMYQRTGKVVLWKDIKDETRRYLQRVQIENVPFIKMSNRVELWKNKEEHSLIGIKIMNRPKQVDEMIAETKKILYQWFPERRAEQYVKQISEYIRHIAGNSLEHSDDNNKGVCYYMLQRYNPKDKPMTVHVAFGDVGMGFEKSMAPKHPWIAEQGKSAIREAFINGLSCRGKNKGGFGFRTVKLLLKGHGGEIRIRSGCEMLRYIGKSGRHNIRCFDNSLVGTQTLIILK